jgi:hypothetical protein
VTARAVESLRFREATADDAEAVLVVLNDAAQWLVDQNIRQWHIPFPPELIENDLQRHRVFLAMSEQDVVATVAVLTDDPMFWGDQLPGCWYLHRLARRHDAPGVGGALLHWTEQRARHESVDRIRLDCGAGLRRYYEASGYQLCWTMSLLNPTSSPPRSLWYCYEKPLTP